MNSLFSLAGLRVHYHCSPRRPFHFQGMLPVVPLRSSHRYGAFIVLGFYEEMADFAAMSEDQGFLGQCATEIAEPMRVDERRVSLKFESDLLPAHPRQLQLLIIENESRVI
jgi:hypothetical protein